MARGGKRPGAGRKPGSRPRPAAELKAEKAVKEMARAMRAAQRQARLEAEADRAAERAGRKAEREAERAAAGDPGRGEKLRGEIMPALATIPCPPDVEPLDFLKSLMREPGLPLGFRRDCAALALPYAHAKPIMGLKDARRLAAFDDDGDDDIAAAMRA
jgi:hypothetical protein